MQKKTRSQRILQTLYTKTINSGSPVVFDTKLAKRVFVKERKSLTSRRFDSNVMRIARLLRQNNYLTGENGQFLLTLKGATAVK